MESIRIAPQVGPYFVYSNRAVAAQIKDNKKEKVMPLITVLVVLIVVGVLVWLVNTQIPMVAWMKTLINVLAVVFVCLWLLQIFGLWAGLGDIRVGPVR